MKHRKLFLWLAVALVIALIVVVAGGWWGASYAYKNFTSVAPQALPESKLSAEAAAELRMKVGDFDIAYEAGNAATLKLSTAELNALVAEHTPLGGQVYLAVTNGQLRGQVSLALDKAGVEALRGRYLNGDATFSLGMSNTAPVLCVAALAVNGRPLPGPLQALAMQRNLAADAASDATAAEYMQRIDGLRVTNDQVIIHFKAAQ